MMRMFFDFEIQSGDLLAVLFRERTHVGLGKVGAEVVLGEVLTADGQIDLCAVDFSLVGGLAVAGDQLETEFFALCKVIDHKGHARFVAIDICGGGQNGAALSLDANLLCRQIGRGNVKPDGGVFAIMLTGKYLIHDESSFVGKDLKFCLWEHYSTTLIFLQPLRFARDEIRLREHRAGIVMRKDLLIGKPLFCKRVCALLAHAHAVA